MKRTKKLAALLLAIVIAVTCGCSPAYGEGDGATLPAYGEIYEEIAESLKKTETLSDWQVFDLAVYSTVSGEDALSQAQIESYVKNAAASVSAETPYITDIAKAEIILNAAGVDTTSLQVDEEKTLNNKALLSEVSDYATYSDAIWALLAYESGNIEVSPEQLTKALTVISESMNSDGLLFGTYGDYAYTDIDSTGAAVGALARFVRDENDALGVKVKAQELYDRMLAALAQSQGDNGSYGSACTDAFVIIGLVSAGIDPADDARFVKGEGEGSKSLVDGLLSYAVEGGFSGYDGTLDLEWSTEQGFRALVALSAFEKGEKAPCNLYNIKPADNDTTPEPEPEPEPEPTPDPTPVPTPTPAPDNTITVSFELKTHKTTWVEKYFLEVEKGTTVRDLLKKVFEEKGIGSVGLGTGYLRSVTYNGETLAEFDVGANSGWQYYVDGVLPMRGISGYKLSDGEDVLLKFTADYASGGLVGGKDDKEHEEEIKEEAPKTEEPIESIAYSDVSESDWFAGSVSFVSAKGFMKGVSQGEFAPHSPLTRAMFVTVLYRIAGEPSASGEVFVDVPDGMWYTNAIAWASENKIASGIGGGKFSPDEPITREQMATLIYRYALQCGLEGREDELTYSDRDGISDYAKAAVSFVSATGIMQGSGGAFLPQENSKRCEAAAVFERLYNATVK